MTGSATISRLGPLLVSIAAILWAFDAPLRAKLGANYSPEFIVLVSHVLATLVLSPFLFTRVKASNLDSKSLALTFYIAAAGSALGTVLFTTAFVTTSNYNIPILVQKLQPVFAIALARFVLREELSKKFLILAAIAIAGAYLVTFELKSPVSNQIKDVDLKAIAYALGAAFIWGSTTVAGRYVANAFSPTLTTALRYLFGMLVLVVWTFFSGSMQAGWNVVSVDDLSTFLLIALGPGLGALLIYYYGLARTPARIATLAELAFPVSAVVVNWTILGATLSLTQTMGAAIMFSAVAAISLDRPPSPRPQ